MLPVVTVVLALRVIVVIVVALVLRPGIEVKISVVKAFVDDDESMTTEGVTKNENIFD